MCGRSGKRFPASGRKVYCSEKCWEQGQRAADAKRAKKYRRNKGASRHGLALKKP